MSIQYSRERRVIFALAWRNGNDRLHFFRPLFIPIIKIAYEFIPTAAPSSIGEWTAFAVLVIVQILHTISQ
jgi:hypothetical protein